MRILPKALAPKLAVGALTMTLAIVCVVILVLFANTRQTIDALLAESFELRRATLAEQSESRAIQATAALEREIDGLIRSDRMADLLRSIDESKRDVRDLDIIRITASDGSQLAGNGAVPAAIVAALETQSVVWQADILWTRRAITLNSRNLGMLTTGFSLAAFNAELQRFRDDQRAVRAAWQRDATVRTLLLSLVAAVLCALLGWIVARSMVKPVRALTTQARRLQRGDFGEPIDVRRDDELGELARSFNRMRDQLRQTTISRDYVDNVLSSMNDALIVTSSDGTITHCNSAAIRLTGFTETQLLGRRVEDLVHPNDRERFRSSEPGMQPRDTRFVTNDGQSIPVSWTMSEIDTDDPILAGRIYAAQNISERKRSEARIRYLARIDPLTKVPNRMQFQHLLQRALSKARRAKHQLTLFYLDVDQFKDINDTFGHLAGDTTLETLTRCMSEALPEGAIIGRLAGDEFAAFLEHAPGDVDAETLLRKIAGRLLTDIAEPFDVQGNEVYMTASLGVALYPDHADNVIDLLRNADAALYAAKKAGGNRMAFYDKAMNDAAVERLMMKSRLRRSFERDELLVNYQPKYELSTGRIAGAEALVRWDMPEHGRVQPNDFIPLAEQTNLIIEIGEWVIERVCHDISLWRDRIGDPGRIAINLSLKQLRQKQFFNRINAIFDRYSIRPSDIEFEITETTLMEDIPRTVALLDKLQAAGLQLAIDDFGTGYSSLSALQKFPIKTLKVDRSFVINAATDENDAAIISAIVDMSRSLRLDVVAEGIENQAQLRLLRQLRCDYGQGMLFGEPMLAEEYTERLHAQMEGTDQHRALFG